METPAMCFCFQQPSPACPTEWLDGPLGGSNGGDAGMPKGRRGGGGREPGKPSARTRELREFTRGAELGEGGAAPGVGRDPAGDGGDSLGGAQRHLPDPLKAGSARSCCPRLGGTRTLEVDRRRGEQARRPVLGGGRRAAALAGGPVSFHCRLLPPFRPQTPPAPGGSEDGGGADAEARLWASGRAPGGPLPPFFGAAGDLARLVRGAGGGSCSARAWSTAFAVVPPLPPHPPEAARPRRRLQRDARRRPFSGRPPGETDSAPPLGKLSASTCRRAKSWPRRCPAARTPRGPGRRQERGRPGQGAAARLLAFSPPGRGSAKAPLPPRGGRSPKMAPGRERERERGWLGAAGEDVEAA
ncbi:basic salivary proline-rich protein 4-like [Sphaerodactylus townsendi]|uniref:basic salivary proline-rich protein 4-like n=1 Tax=Sphaerodactylus townsendi TaxID=933632 RepID=UPI002026726F|nr:basic salivary proline-rich protein 4-like [Sphaerodactylus townsendi]